MDLEIIRNRLLATCAFIKDAQVEFKNNQLHAIITPNFQILKEKNILNIKEEIRWYGVEAYNLEAKEEQKIRSFEFVVNPATQESEPQSRVYTLLKEYLQMQSTQEVLLSSHLEFHLGLDSLDFVSLLVFIEKSFGLIIDEATLSKMMQLKELYEYIEQNKKFIINYQPSFDEILHEKVEEKLIYSPVIMFLYKFLLMPIFKLFFRLEVEGVANIPHTPCIIAPNHQSMLDGFLILATMPFEILKRSFFLAYKNVFGTKLLKPLAKHGQNILIDANVNLKETLLYTSLPLREGSNVVIFPEGARTRDGKLLEFRPFYVMLAQAFHLPIVPVVIDGSYEALKSGTIFPKPKKIKMKYLKPIYPSNMSIEEMNSAVKERILDELESL